MRQVATYQGSCHCGAVQFQVETDFPELTTCDCSICSRKNAMMVKVHESKFTLLAGEQSLTEYQNFDPAGIPVRATVGKGMS